MPATYYPGQAYPAQERPADGSGFPATSFDGLNIEVAFGSNPNNPNPAWINVTNYVSAFVVKRGRQQELDAIDTGTATVRFNNSDRRFDPTHTGSPWYPLVLPMRRLRIRWKRNNVIYPLFNGFVDAWPQTAEGPNVGWSEVNATDGFRVLGLVDVGDGTTWDTELSGTRINRILDKAGWSSTDRVIDVGQSLIESTTPALGSGTTALGAIQDVARAELGAFFFDGSGRAVFHDRNHRRQTSYLTSQAVFSDGNVGGLIYQDVQIDTDADRIWNDVQITADGGAVSQAQDTTSQATYMRRTLARQIPLYRTTEAADQAAYLLAQYKDPRLRLSSIRVTATSDALWAQALGRELGDHITVKRWPQKVGSVVSQECAVEALEIRGTPAPPPDYGIITTTWLLSTNAFSVVNWWILNDATYGLEGTTTILTY